MPELPPDKLNAPSPSTLDYLLSRRSASPKRMTGPGPNPDQLKQILAAGARVPDHGKLAPWRFIVFERDARRRMGDILAEAVMTERDTSPERANIERQRFLRAPVVIGVVSRVRDGIAIPVWEQQMSSGASCTMMLLAAHAFGFDAAWVTEWCAYHPQVLQRIGLQPTERIAGFVYVGKSAVPLEDRARPELEPLITYF